MSIPPKKPARPFSKDGKRPFGKPSFGKPSFGGKKPGQNFPGRDYVKPAGEPATTLMGAKPRGSGHLPHADNDLIHGIHAVVAALGNAKRKPVHLWTTENGLARLKEDLPDAEINAELVHPRIIDHILSGHDAVHQGVLLEAKPLNQPRLDQIPRDGLLVILDQVTDPHNVGAILRSCSAFNVTALVTTARHAPHETGVFFKAASGATEHVPVVRVTNLGRAMEELKSYGFALLGLDSEAPITMAEAPRVRPLALVLGAEGKGLRQKTAELCDHVARLDMPGAIKSLNVSIATAITLYALSQ
jgi:23S rRNA (guanosine2251-2'-O)-methyltransferase